MRLIMILPLLPFIGAQVVAQSRVPYQNPSLPTEERIKDLVIRMTLEEKVAMLAGTGFETKPNERLGIPSLKMTDGPVGVRWGKSTAFPSSIAMAATWNPSLIRKLGSAIAREVKGKGRHMILAPCININRVPHGGRNFESFGEDPFLTSRMAVEYVKGVQEEKVVACAKHYAANNQEWQRGTISANVDEQTLREIYLPAFRAAVQEGGAWTVMSAYNKLNATYCSEHPWLLTDVLKNEWGLKGFVVSDWGAVHSTVPTANAGLDLEMPTGQFFNADLLLAVKNGEVKESVIDEKISRILRVMFWAGLFDEDRKENPSLVGSEENRQIALDVAREAIILLKNEQSLLPLRLGSLKSIAVIGPNAAVARTGGGGSSKVDPLQRVSPMEGIRSKLGDKVRMIYAPGCFMEGDITPIEPAVLHPSENDTSIQGLKAEYFDNTECDGKPVATRIDANVDFEWAEESPAAGVPKDRFSVRWSGVLVPPKTGRYEINVQTDDGVRLYIDGRLAIDNWRDHAMETKSVTVELQKGRAHRLCMEYYENAGWAIARLGWRLDSDRLIPEAVRAAQVSDVAIVVGGLSDNYESESFDRENLELPEVQKRLIREVSRVNKNTVVVLNIGAPVLTGDWMENVGAVLLAWYPGQEGGTAIAEALFGDINPSGRLPVTFPKRWEDSPAYGNYPGREGNVEYKEGLLVGYRYFDSNNISPEHPFGYGLSYSKFDYRNLRLNRSGVGSSLSVNVTVDVKNTSSCPGAEVVQLYLHSVGNPLRRPAKELKGFQKVFLKPGETSTVSFELNREAFSFFNPRKGQWEMGVGQFKVFLGSSSRRMRLSAGIDVR